MLQETPSPDRTSEMGMLGKKARILSLILAKKRNRKLKKPKKRLPEEDLRDISIVAVFGKDDDEVLSAGDSDTDGFLDELVDEAVSDISTKRKVLSGSVLSSCCDLVDQDQSVQALISLLNWYQAACFNGHASSGMTASAIQYDIEDSDTLSKVMVFVLQKAHHTFWNMLGLSDSCNKEKILELKNNPKWDGLKPLVKSFLTSTMHLVKKAGDSEIIVSALTQLRVSVLFFAPFPDLLIKLIKVSVHLWVNGEETRSQLAFLILKDISMVFNLECFDNCLINMYRAFLSNCEIPKPNSEERLRLLRDSFVELCSQDVHKSYAKASVSITQLDKLMKIALTRMNKEAVEKIDSEQYTNCVDLWVNCIAANSQDSDFQSLRSTIIQVINGIAQLFIGPRYLLLRVKCVQWLNHLSRTSGLFIPITSLVLGMMEPENWLESQNSQEQCIFIVIELLAVHFAQWSLHISFPELAFIPLMRLREFNESSTMEKLKRPVKRFIEHVELNVKFVQWKREEANISPTDQQSKDAFLQHEKIRGNAPYTQYYQSIIDKARGTKKKKCGKFGN